MIRWLSHTGHLVVVRDNILSASPSNCSPVSHPRILKHESRRHAGFVEPIFLLIIILNGPVQGDGQEQSCADIVRKVRNVQ